MAVSYLEDTSKYRTVVSGISDLGNYTSPDAKIGRHDPTYVRPVTTAIDYTTASGTLLTSA